MNATRQSRSDCRSCRDAWLSISLAAAVTLLAVAPTSAQPAQTQPANGQTPASTADKPDRKQQVLQDLDAVARDIKLGQDRQAQIARDIAALDKDRGRITEELVAAAARERMLETNVGASEARIADIEAASDAVRQSLAARRGVLAEVLAALQRIGRKPPPAIVVRPEDALASVRSAILFGAVLPQLRAEADKVAADLSRLVELKTQSAAEHDQFRQAVIDLKDESARLEQLLDERRQSKSEQETRLDEERRKEQELSDKAGSLRDLISRFDSQATGLRGEVSPTGKAGADGKVGADGSKLASLTPGPDQKSVTPPGGDPARLHPAIHFADAKARLPMPVAGAIVKSFGDDDGTGSPMKGIRIATQPDARVSSPCDGSIMYAGLFRSYGKLLIIDGGDGYHVVLAGLERIDVERGQFVLVGEPVGMMSAHRLASASNDVNSALPLLYVEFWKDSTPIDPTPWWAQTLDEKVRG